MNTLALLYYAIWFQCTFHFSMIHLCDMYRVIIGGNLVRLSKEPGMQKTRLISFWYMYFNVKNTGIKKLIGVRENLVIDTFIEKVIQLSKSDTVIEKWHSYWKVTQLSKSDTVIERWYSYRKVTQLSKSDRVIEKW